MFFVLKHLSNIFIISRKLVFFPKLIEGRIVNGPFFSQIKKLILKQNGMQTSLIVKFQPKIKIAEITSSFYRVKNESNVTSKGTAKSPV